MTKKCPKCNKQKPKEDFGKSKHSKSGLSHWCKKCANNYSKEWAKKNPEKEILKYKRYREKNKEKKKKWNEENSARKNELQREWRKNNREVCLVQATARNATRSGKLIRTNICSNCGAEGKTHFHHSKYSKPLEVIELCPTCHTQFHNKIRLEARLEQIAGVATNVS